MTDLLLLHEPQLLLHELFDVFLCFKTLAKAARLCFFEATHLFDGTATLLEETTNVAAQDLRLGARALVLPLLRLVQRL